MVEILALAPHMLMRLGEPADRLAPAGAAFLATRDAALALRHIALGLSVAAGIVDHHAIGKRRERLQAEVYPGLLSGGRQRLDGHLRTGEGHRPPIGLLGDRDRLRTALQRTGPVDADAPDLGEHKEAVIQTSAVAVFLEGEGVEAIAVAALEAGEARLLSSLPALHPLEERLVGSI